MAPTFKNPLRGLLSSTLPTSVMSSLDTMPGSKAIPPVNPRLAIVIWVQMILSYLQGWTSESVAVWQVLTDYRLEKAYHCKCTGSQNEHEFVIYEFSDEQRDKLELRADRWVGKRKASPGTTPESDSDISSMSSSYTRSEEFSPHPSPYFSNRRSSRLSLSVISMKEGLTKISGSFRQVARRLSDSSIPRPSAISSGHCLASDTIVKINGHPKDCEVIRVLTFRDNRVSWPSLWDIMILIHVVHNDSTTYTLMERQCYWFADTMFGLLERWSTEHKNGTVTSEDRKKWWWLKRVQASTGSLGIVPVHHRDDEHMLELWNKYMSERQDMNSQREGFEQRQTEILRRADELAREVVELKMEQVEREHLLKEEQAEKERWLKEHFREEQAERERLLKEEQAKKERWLKEHFREEQAERERQLKEEQEQKERQLREQFEQQLQRWQMRLQQEQENNERRYQDLTNMIKLVRNNTHHLNELEPAPSQSVRPQSHS